MVTKLNMPIHAHNMPHRYPYILTWTYGLTNSKGDECLYSPTEQNKDPKIFLFYFIFLGS